MNKEAVVVILDANSSMAKTLSGRGETQCRIQSAKESIKMLLEQKLLHNPKHDFGLVMFGTRETSNQLNDNYPNEFQNVTVERAMGPIDLEFFREVQNIEAEKVSQNKGDMFDGLNVGLDMLTKFVGTKKYKKRIFLITDGENSTNCDNSQIREMVETINKNDVKLNCITVDFCQDIAEDDSDEEDEENEIEIKQAKENNETENQQQNRQLLLDLQDQTGCAIIPAQQAIEIYQEFKKKEYLTRTKFKGNLQLSADLNVAVQIFTKAAEHKIPALKKYSKNLPENDDEKAGKIVMERTYAERDDPDQKEVPEDKHAKAFNYGKQLVPVSKENEHVLKLGKKPSESAGSTPLGDDQIKMQKGGTEREFKLLGFSDQSQVPRHHFMAGVDIVLPMKGSKNERAFAAMVYSMIDTNKVLLAKIIERANSDPKLVVMYPHISKKQAILYLAQIPTAEDLRDFQFPSLVQSTNKQRQAASNLINKLNLTEDPDDEQLEVERTFNPTIQYFNQVVTHKASNPEQANVLPEMNEAIKDQLSQDPEMAEAADQEIEEFQKAFTLVQNEPEEGADGQKKQRITWGQIIKQEEDKLKQGQIVEQKIPETEEEAMKMKGQIGDDEEEAIKEIGSVDPIGDFKKMVTNRKTDMVKEALRQMQSLIERYIRSSLRGDLYDKAIECLQNAREASITEDEAQCFNTFMHKLKDQCVDGPHSDFFDILVKNKITLISNGESKISSDVTQQEAENYLLKNHKASIQKGAQKDNEDEEDFDLLD